MTVYFSSQGFGAQTNPLNVEPENPPGYAPPNPGALSPQLKPGSPSVTAPPQNAPTLPSTAPPPAATPVATTAPGASPASTPPAPASPEETPSPAASNFQNAADISKAALPVTSDPIAAPQVAPSYPGPSPGAKNKIIEVTKGTVDKKLFATVSTSMGNFKIKLFPQYAPKTVKNFTDLATGQKEFVEVATSRKSTRPFYNGQIIFKVVRDFVIQMGCPFGDGRGGPGYEIPDEYTPYLHHDKAGTVSMANHGPNTGGSQFYITLGPQPSFDD